MDIVDSLVTRVETLEKNQVELFDRMGKVEDKASSAWKTINEVKETVKKLLEDVKDLKVAQAKVGRTLKVLSILIGVMGVISIGFFVYIWRHDAELAKSIVSLGTLVGSAIA